MNALGIKFVVSDLDGVIRHFPSDRNFQIEQRFHLPAGSLLGAAFEKILLTRAVCGIISDELWRQEIVNQLSQSYPVEKATLAVREWSDFPGKVDWDYLASLEKWFPNIPVAILTNGTTRLPKDLEALGLQTRFFRVFNSAEIGSCKPDIKVFEHVVSRLDCRPSDILFVDDSESHVRAAKALGIKGYHYKSLVDFESAMAACAI